MVKSFKALATVAALLCAGLGGRADAQGVDRYQFLQLEQQVRQMNDEISRLRNAVSGGGMTLRLNQLEDEISRLTGQLEQLQFAVRRQEEASKLKLQDLEYRIIELEGGDPSILFQEEQNDQGSVLPAPGAPPAAPPTGGTLGVITTTANVAGPERSAFEAAAGAVRAGRPEEGRNLLERFLSDYPGTVLAGDANFWLGESYYQTGDYQRAANRFLDGATLTPGSAIAPESLLKLGVTLSLLGQTDVACSTLREVGQRYPGATDAVQRAEVEAQRTGCG